jgi:hypothetical protein
VVKPFPEMLSGPTFTSTVPPLLAIGWLVGSLALRGAPSTVQSEKFTVVKVGIVRESL